MNINDQLRKLFEPIIEEMLQKEAPPPNALVSAAVWKEKKRQELLDFYGGKKEFDRIDAALRALQADFSTELSPVQLDQLKEEWERGVANLLNSQEEEGVTLCRVMRLSESFLETFYSFGVKSFKGKNFAKAADIFFLLSLIDFQRPSIWESLGLSEMQLGEFELALNAFAMASITNPDSPYPFIHSAECCIALNRFAEASTYFDLAKEAISHTSGEEKVQLIGQVRGLERSCHE